MIQVSLLLALAIIVRIIFFFFYFDTDVNIFMLKEFDQRALDVLHNKEVKDFTAWGSYPLFLFVVYKFLDFFGAIQYRLEVIFFLNQFLSLSAVFLIFHSLKINFQKFSNLFLLLSLVILNPYYIYLSAMNMSESLFIFVVSLFLWIWHKHQESQSLLKVLFAGVLIGIAVALRNISSLFLVLFLIALIFDIFKLKSHRTQTGLFSLSFLITSLALSFLSSMIDSKNQFSTSLNRGPNIAQTWCEAQKIETSAPGSEFWFRPPEYQKGFVTTGLYVDAEFGSTSYFLKLALSCVVDTPSTILIRLRSLLNIFNGQIYPDPLKLDQLKTFTTFKVLHLAVFIFILFSLKVLIQKKGSWIFLLYLFGCLGAVFVGNVGEARFFYSIFPGVLALLCLSLAELSLKKSLIVFSVSLVAAGSLQYIPSTLQLQLIRDSVQFNALSKSGLEEKIAEHLSFIKSQEQHCGLEFALIKDLKDQKKGLSEFKNFLKTQYVSPITEDGLFCRNLLLISARNKGLVQIEFSDFGQVGSLPGGLESPQPIVAVVAQMMQYDLYIGIGKEDLIPESERYYKLVERVFRYQHRLKYNSSNKLGAVTEYLEIDKPSSYSAFVFAEALKVIRDSLSFHTNNNIPLDRLKIL